MYNDIRMHDQEVINNAVQHVNSINQLLIIQMQHERTNSAFYKTLSGICDCKGLLGASKYFAKQAQEELAHFELIFNYCCDRIGFVPELLEIPAIEFNENMFLVDMIKASLDLEILTTQKLCGIKKMSIEQNDFMTDSFLDQMIIEQIQEEKQYSDLFNRALMFCDSPTGVYMFDNEMGA